MRSFSPLRATFPAQLMLLDLITRITVGEDNKPQSWSLCSFLHPYITHSP